MKFTIIILSLLFVSPACPADKWDNADVQREVAAITLNVMDGVTTERILDEIKRAFEAGPARLLFGDRPSQAELAGVVVVSSALHATVTHYLPAKYRQYWQWSWIAVKVGVIGNNLHVGLGIQF